MRFAGQRFRAPRQGQPKFKTQRGQAESGRSAYVNPTGVSAMTSMPEVNVSSMAFTGMPNMSNPDFSIPSGAEPDFKAPGRV